MEYRNLGLSGLRISPICLGTMMFGGPTDEALSSRIINKARETGVNFIDTADVYNEGRSEEFVGRAIAPNRTDWVLATKVANPTGSSPNSKGLSRRHIMEAAEASLRRLGTDWIDIYYLHKEDHATPLAETVGAMGDLVRQGKIRYFGVSNYRAWRVAEICRLCDELGTDRPIVSQPYYNAMNRMPEVEVLPACGHYGLGVASYSPIARGILAGKYLPGQAPPEGSRATDPTGSGFIKGFLRDEVLERVQRLKPLADEAGLSLAQLAVAWVLQNDNVATAIVGASRPEQVRDNVAAAGVKLEDDLMKAVDDVLEGVVVSDPGKTSSPATRP